MSGNDTHADTPVRAFPSVEDCDEAILNPQWVLDHPDEYDIEARVQADKDVRRWTRFREYAVAMRALIADRDEQRDSLLDAIEALGRERARADQAEAALDTLIFWTEEHLEGLGDIAEMDEDDEQILTSLRFIIAGEKAHTEEPDFSPEQWRTLGAIADRRAALSAGSGGREPLPKGHEGMVTVYDHKGGYLGCMGRETWDKAIADEAQRRETTRNG